MCYYLHAICIIIGSPFISHVRNGFLYQGRGVFSEFGTVLSHLYLSSSKEKMLTEGIFGSGIF
jgi:hypothetical protein